MLRRTASHRITQPASLSLDNGLYALELGDTYKPLFLAC